MIKQYVVCTLLSSPSSLPLLPSLLIFFALSHARSLEGTSSELPTHCKETSSWSHAGSVEQEDSSRKADGLMTCLRCTMGGTRDRDWILQVQMRGSGFKQQTVFLFGESWRCLSIPPASFCLVWLCMQVHMHVCIVHTHGGQSSTSSVFPQKPSTLSLLCLFLR